MPTSDADGKAAWRSSRRACLLAAALLLGACVGPENGGGLGLLAGPDQHKAPALRKVALYRGNVVVAGPEGYCIDRESLQRGVTGGFVLLASCETLADKPGKRVQPAIMTVSVLPRRAGVTQPTAQELAASMAPAKALQGFDGDGLSLVRLSSGGDALLPAGDPRYWRGAMMINGHLTGLAVYGPRGSTVGTAAGRHLMLDLAEALRENSPVRRYDPPAALPVAAPKTEPKAATAGATPAVAALPDADETPKKAPKSLAQLLGGLFPIPD